MRSMEPGPAKTGPRKDLQTIRTLLPYLWPKGEAELRLRVVCAMALLALAKVTNVAVPIFYKHAVDALSTDTARILAVPVALLVGYGLARVLAQTFGELRDAVFAKVAQRAIRMAGLRTFQHLHRLSLRFHMDRKTGGISRAVERGTKGIEFLLTFMLFNVLPTLLEIALVCAVMWKLYGVWYALATFLTMAVYIAWTLIITEWRIQYRRTMNETDSEANTRAIDSLLNFETVKYFGNEDHEARRFDASLKGYERAAVKSKTTLSYLNIGQGAIIAVGVTVVMLMAANGVVGRVMTLGDFVLVNAYLIQLFLPLNFLGFVYREIKRSLTDMETMFELLDENAEIEDAPGARALAVNGGRVVFDDVSFAYDSRRPVLEGVSFAIEPGRTVAIVGSSGAGKSTISRLLFRFSDVTGGRITIDGQDIRTMDLGHLRINVAAVTQESTLFKATIRDNIMKPYPNATMARVLWASKMVGLHGDVERMADGYETMIEEGGANFSGELRQKIAITRALIRNPKILILDEALSNFDIESEIAIKMKMSEINSGRTLIIITNRLSQIMDSDLILVMKEGVLVQSGSHEELAHQPGLYADLWRKELSLSGVAHVEAPGQAAE